MAFVCIVMLHIGINKKIYIKKNSSVFFLTSVAKTFDKKRIFFNTDFCEQYRFLSTIQIFIQDTDFDEKYVLLYKIRIY